MGISIAGQAGFLSTFPLLLCHPTYKKCLLHWPNHFWRSPQRLPHCSKTVCPCHPYYHQWTLPHTLPNTHRHHPRRHNYRSTSASWDPNYRAPHAPTAYHPSTPHHTQSYHWSSTISPCHSSYYRPTPQCTSHLICSGRCRSRDVDCPFSGLSTCLWCRFRSRRWGGWRGRGWVVGGWTLGVIIGGGRGRSRCCGWSRRRLTCCSSTSRGARYLLRRFWGGRVRILLRRPWGANSLGELLLGVRNLDEASISSC